MKNTIQVSFMENGLVRFETGEFSPAVHAGADRLINVTLEALGGTVEKTKAKHTHSHTHTHDHEHQH